ncbi:SDR family oxidoreductase [Paracoccus zeaxanthinifaciens]|uniref:SDR family oxidoreductase n=1 Tax=Paracoccus zeaxanthinifaciens TaxID=187400 RepID=UPI0003B5CB02|nr:SDR family oxidoreductase [Paracoccus zeaxanthinifaciens]
MSIENKVVLITGASSGLGEATARHLAERGAKLALAARRQDKLETIAEDLRAKGTEVEVIQTDVTDRAQVQTMVDRTVERFGRMDVIVNNAGLMAIAPMDEAKVDEWDKMIDINIKGVLYGIASALPVFRKQQSGHFINLSSVAGIKVFAPGGTVYSGTKYAVRAITDGLRAEVGGNIRTTSIEPGAVDSELKYGSSHEESSEAVQQFYQQAIPSDSVARAIAYAIEQPDEVDINEIVLRPTSQEF